MRTFWCDTCDPKKEMTPDEFKQHLKTVHKFDGKVTGSKKGISFLDFEDGFTNTFAWTLPGNVKATEVQSGRKESYK